MAYLDDDEGQSLPAPAGSGRLLGLKPQEWLAAFGGLLGGLPLGRPGTAMGQVRPFNALFPVAQGLENRDNEARRQQLLQGFQSQYGNDPVLSKSPEYGMALRLINEGDMKGGMALLLKGITDRQTIDREDRRTHREGESALLANEAFRPVREPGIVGFGPMPDQAGTGDLLRPPSTTPADFQDTQRAPEMGEILDRFKALATEKPELAGLAAKLAQPTLAQMTQEDAKLRPKSEERGGVIYQHDPRRGTMKATGFAPETEERRGLIDLRKARAREQEALIAKHTAQTAKLQRESPYPVGSPQNPHTVHKIGVDPKDGVRKILTIRSWAKPNPDAPGGIERGDSVSPLFPAPFRPHAPHAGLQSKESETVTDDVTPRKQITQQDVLMDLKATATSVVADTRAQLTQKGAKFDDAARTVTLPNGDVLRQEDVYSRAFQRKNQANPEVGDVAGTIAWDGKRFSLIQAWVPEQKKRRVQRTISGPRGTLPPPPAALDEAAADDDEED